MVFRRFRDRRGFFPSSKNKNNDHDSEAAVDDNNKNDNNNTYTMDGTQNQHQQQNELADSGDDVMAMNESMLPPDVNPSLARAWFNRRRNDLLQEQQNKIIMNNNNIGISDPNVAIDVDNLSAWDKNNNDNNNNATSSDNTENSNNNNNNNDYNTNNEENNNNDNTTVSADTAAAVIHSRSNSIKQRPGRRIRPDSFSSLNTNSYNYDNESLVSSVVSEMTPVISNKNNKFSPLIPTKGRGGKATTVESSALASVLESQQHSPTGASAAEAAATGDTTTTNNTSNACDLLNAKKWQGKLLYSLLLLLLVCVATVVTTALLFKNSNYDKDSATSVQQGNENGGGGDGFMSVPTLSPDNIEQKPDDEIDDGVQLIQYNRTRPKPTPAPTIEISNDEPTMAPNTISTTTPTITNNMPVFQSSVMIVQGMQGEEFGKTVTLSRNGKVLAIGAPGYNNKTGRVLVLEMNENYNSTTNNNNDDNNGNNNNNNNNSPWIRRSIVEGITVGENAGSAIALNSDGSVLAISAPKNTNKDGTLQNAGSVRVYFYNSNTRKYDDIIGQELYGDVINAFFGGSITLSSSGQILAVGAPFHTPTDMTDKKLQGRVVVYKYNYLNNRWDEQGRPLVGFGPNHWFGYAMDLYEDNDDESLVLVASAPKDTTSGGYVVAYELNDDGYWNPLGVTTNNVTTTPMTNKKIIVSTSAEQQLTSSEDFYGFVLSIVKTKSNSYRVAVGMPLKDDPMEQKDVGMVIVYDLVTIDRKRTWKQLGDPIISQVAKQKTGFSVSLVDYGQRLIIGSPGWQNSTGLVTVYEYNSNDDDNNNQYFNLVSVAQGLSYGDDFGTSVCAVRRPIDNKLIIAIGAESVTAGVNETGYVALLEAP